MAGPWAILIRAFVLVEDVIVDKLLRSPTFHRNVRRIHRAVEDRKHGRDPHEPLRQGEATKDPNEGANGFLNHFIDELRSQFRGTPNAPPPRPPKGQSKK